jgi:hypothetical protein
MELDENTLNAAWTKDSNGKPEFFIINDALISKLCVLGEDVEPCFEGASITAPIIQFSLDDGFREQLFSMMQELKDLLSEGGTKVFTRYAVEIGDALWTALYSHIDEKYSNENGLMYSIKGVYEEGDQKFAVLSADDNYFRLNFSFSENNEFEASDDLVSLDSYTPDSEPQFADEAVAEYAKKKKEEKEEEEKKSAEKEDKSNSEDNDKNDNNSEGKTEDDEEEEEKKKKKNKFAEDKKCPKCGKPVDECECEDEDENEDKKKKFSLEDIPEYVELQSKYSELETKYNNLVTEKENLESQLAPLAEFKAAAVRKEKENMISSFTMLSEEDKQDVLTNIDTYSLDEIEGKLSIICVRNRVNFSLDEDKTPDGITTFNLEGGEDLSTPAWVKAAMAVAKNMN